MKVARFALAVVALLFARPAEAQDAHGGLPNAIDAAVPGTGSEAGYLIAPLLIVRMDAPALTIQYRIGPSSSDPDGKAVLRSGRFLADGFSPERGFHLSGGLRFRRNMAWALAAPMARATYFAGGRRYSAADVGTDRAGTAPASAAPLVTIGYGGAIARGLAFGVKAGALFHGAATAQAHCAPAPYCGSMGADLDAQRLGAHHGISRYKVYPLLEVRMGYRF
jgi:hypothetical protein